MLPFCLDAIAEEQQLPGQFVPLVLVFQDDLFQTARKRLVVLGIIIHLDLEMRPRGVFHL